ncbi:hypothetical protein QYZ88_003670 [Lachnospiraceae bacterium C1.1]|nr:hypothetical protein [Lachnospiraceae bacterium C1.1]
MDSNNEYIVFGLQQAISENDIEAEQNYKRQLYENNKEQIFEITKAFKDVYAKTEADKKHIDEQAVIAFIDACQSYTTILDMTFTQWISNVIKTTLKNKIRQDELVNQYDGTFQKRPKIDF